MTVPILEPPRLILRGYKNEDFPALAERPRVLARAF
jgi:hypothetical protein